MKNSILILAILILVSCNNTSNNNDNEVLDSAQHAQLIYHNDSVLVSENNMVNWVGQTLSVKNIGFKNIELENFWNDDSLEKIPFTPTDNFYKDYASVLHWSPDSSYILDIGSYGSIVVKDKQGNTTLEGGDPDTEISVLYPKQNQRTKLLFAGPASYIIDAQWIDPSQVIILGTFDQENSQNKDTLLWLIDVKDNFFRLYNYKTNRQLK